MGLPPQPLQSLGTDLELHLGEAASLVKELRKRGGGSSRTQKYDRLEEILSTDRDSVQCLINRYRKAQTYLQRVQRQIKDGLYTHMKATPTSTTVNEGGGAMEGDAVASHAFANQVTQGRAELHQDLEKEKRARLTELDQKLNKMETDRMQKCDEREAALKQREEAVDAREAALNQGPDQDWDTAWQTMAVKMRDLLGKWKEEFGVSLEIDRQPPNEQFVLSSINVAESVVQEAMKLRTDNGLLKGERDCLQAKVWELENVPVCYPTPTKPRCLCSPPPCVH